MREEIRLGNEALAHHDMEAAKRHFQQLLAAGGTPIQERIAANRLREIHEQQAALLKPPVAKPRKRRKTAADTARAGADKRKPIRLPDNPLVVINKY